MSGIIRTRRAPSTFFQARKAPFLDARLSFAARGLLAYLFTKPDNWETRNYDLVNASPGGKAALQSILHELKEYGYISRKSKKNSNGDFSGWETTIFEDPAENPDFGKEEQVTDIPISGKTDNPTYRLSDVPKNGRSENRGENTKNDLTKNDLNNNNGNGNGKNPLYGDTDEYDSLPDIVKQSLRTNDTDWQYMVKRLKSVRMDLSINPAKEDDMWRLYKSLTPPAGETVGEWVDYVASRVADKPTTPGWKFVETIFKAIQTSGSLAKNIAEFEGKYKNGGVKEQTGPVQTTASKLSPEQLEMIKQFSNGGEKRNYVHG